MNSDWLLKMVKKATAMLVFFALFLHCLCQLGVFTYFYVNQDYIATNLCINRDESVKNCEGRCYLDKMMSQAGTNQEDLPAGIVKVQEILLYFNYANSGMLLFPSSPPSNDKCLLADQKIWYNIYRNSIFQPPRAS